MLTYALIVSKENCHEKVYEQIKELKNGVYRLYKVSGEYDLLAEIKLQSEEKMKEILNKIKSLEGVMTLKTCTVLHKTKEHNQPPKIV